MYFLKQKIKYIIRLHFDYCKKNHVDNNIDIFEA